mmetsp:Transcript_62731/g.161425  ORF Transcript_62731/g.161425 Transcript_62731/m.161425 type:complete len:160 (+) Transcript_62731:282-761(+)
MSAEGEHASPRPVLLGQRRPFKRQVQVTKAELVVKNVFAELVATTDGMGLRRTRSCSLCPVCADDMVSRHSMSMAPLEQAPRKAESPACEAAETPACENAPAAETPHQPSREPELSIGSTKHSSGECRPCVWFYRPQGCANGANCHHFAATPTGPSRRF